MTEKDQELMLDVGQANELKLAFRRTGWTNEDIKRLCEGKAPRNVLRVVRGLSEIKDFVYVFDMDADPTLPEWAQVESQKMAGRGKLESDGEDLFLNGKKVNLVVFDALDRLVTFPGSRSVNDGPVEGKHCVIGEKLLKEAETKKVLNLTVLNYLMSHPELIPKSWKGKRIVFWGTILRHPSRKSFYVGVLSWHPDFGNPEVEYRWLKDKFFQSHMAPVIAS